MTTLRKAAVLFLVALLSHMHISPAVAQGRIAIVRDAEIEGLLASYARPILRAAGLSRKGIEIIIVNDNSFNAFVTGRRIFINTGAFANSTTPNEIIGVLAHEAGHLAGGHQERLRQQVARARTMAIVGSLLGVGAIAAGTATGSRSASSAGAGIISSAPNSARRLLLAYQRGEEMNADQAAVRFLNKTKQSAAGMLKTFERFSRGLALAGVGVDPYQQSHPLPRERIALMERLARESPYFGKQDSKNARLKHDLARAKIAAFAGGGAAVARMFRDDRGGLPAQYGNAISTHLAGNSRSGLQKINGLLKKMPKNAYLHEMKGEMLLALRDTDGAVKAFKRAKQLDKSGTSLIRARLGFALVASGNPKNAKAAIKELKGALSSDPDNINAYRQLAQAYGMTGDVGNAELSMAEGYFRAGNIRQAKSFASRAVQRLPRNTPAFRRANDILTVGG